MDIKKPCVVEVGPIDARGGISAVIHAVIDSGRVQSNYDVTTVNTSMYRDGPAWQEVFVSARALWRIVWLVLDPAVVVVHLHASYGVSFYRKAVLFSIARLFRKAVVFHVHSGRVSEFYCGGGVLRRAVVGFVLGHADAVIVLAPEFASLLSAAYPSPRYRVVSNPLTLPILPLKSSSADSLVTVLYMGFLVAEKGLSDLIEAMIGVASHNSVCLRVCGKGPMERELREMSEKTHWLTIVGWVEGQSRLDEYAHADVFVLPSYYEGVPMALLEAMAFGIPCVATSVGGIPSVLEDGVQGLLIAPNDPSALALALGRLVGDSELRMRMGAAGQEQARAHAPEIIATEWLSVYDAVTRR